MATFLCMHQVVVVGAGPVGMAVAALCVERGCVPVLAERRIGPRDGSRAIGVTPASLEIFSRIGLEQAMLERGVQVRSAYVHNEHRVLGRLGFSKLTGRHPFILVVPQVETEELLRDYLYDHGVAFHEGWSVERIYNGESVRLVLSQAQLDVAPGLRPGDTGSAELRAEYVVCADGFRGALADQLGLASAPQYMPYHFVMGDYVDRSSLGADAHLWFTSFGAVESFPLPAGKRRWIAQLAKDSTEDDEAVERLVHERSGFLLRSEDCSWRSSFQPVRRIATAAATGHCFLAGDALHSMSPIGGQGMNSGIADAELLSELLAALLRSSTPAASGFTGTAGHRKAPGSLKTASTALSLAEAQRLYAHARLRAGSSAAARAEIGTHIGSLRGSIGSGLRSALIHMALNSPLKKYLASHFAMRTIPYRRALHALTDR